MSKNYLDKHEFHAMFVRWHEQKDAEGNLPKIPDDIANGFILLAENIVRSGRFGGYTWTDDLIGYALTICCRYAHKYDPTKSSEAFDYYSQTIKHAFFQENAKQKKQIDIVDAYKTVADVHVNSEFHDITFNPPSIDELRLKSDELSLSKEQLDELRDDANHQSNNEE